MHSQVGKNWEQQWSDTKEKTSMEVCSTSRIVRRAQTVTQQAYASTEGNECNRSLDWKQVDDIFMRSRLGKVSAQSVSACISRKTVGVSAVKAQTRAKQLRESCLENQAGIRRTYRHKPGCKQI